MRIKYIFLAMAVLLVVSAFWFMRTEEMQETGAEVDAEMQQETKLDSGSAASLPKGGPRGSTPGSTNRSGTRNKLRPPDQSRIFADFTPEERVEFARKGHGPGG